jgi:2-furoate---CoA ligase
MDLGTIFQRTVIRDPDAWAVVDGDRRRTYAEWFEDIRRIAGSLGARGIGPGDHIVAVLSNRFEMATLYWACQMLGAVFTPFNWRAGAEEIAHVLADAEARLVVFEDRSRDAVPAAAEQAGVAADALIDIDDGHSFEALVAGTPIDGPAGVDGRETCLMLYTSGTTGRPKGVPRSHSAEHAASSHCVAQLGYGYRSAALGVMPLFHTMGIRALSMAMLMNGKFVCMPTFDAEAALELIARERIEALFLVPTMFHDMLRHERLGEFDLSSVRDIGYAGMSMTSALTARCAEVLKPRNFVNYYGSSEIYTFAFCDHIIDKPGCAGRAGMGQELRIVAADADGNSGPNDIVAPGEIGEVIAPMDGMEAFAGYWKRPDADAKAIRDGWYFTGDLGQFDEDGELFIVGRVDDMIISGGENIHPEEVEDVLDASPLVGQAAVIGLPDDRLGSKVVAFVEPASREANARALDAACLASGLARFKRPRAYVFVEKIPRSASGKLLRRLLRDGEYRTLVGFETTL